jgi:hypothetical protein
MPADWIKPGAEVVVIGGSHLHDHAGPVRSIDRVLKRDVVLDDGTRFSLTRASADCIRGAPRGAWDPTSDLYPADHPRVSQVRRKMLERQVKSRIASLCELLTKSVRHGDWETARQTHADLGNILDRFPEKKERVDADG